MNSEDESAFELVKETRLSETMITKKPQFSGLSMALATVLGITLFSQFYWTDPLGWSQFLPAVSQKVFTSGEWWRVFTAIFIHGDFGHLLSNMMMLGFFSFFVFGYFGFGVFPLLSFFFAGLVNLAAIATYAPEVRLLGASGLVYLLGGFWLTLYYLIQRQYGVINRLLRVVGIAIMLFFPTTFSPQTSYRTHAIGIIFGIVMGLFYFYRNKKMIRSHETYQSYFV